jgi:hypothetical protein
MQQYSRHSLNDAATRREQHNCHAAVAATSANAAAAAAAKNCIWPSSKLRIVAPGSLALLLLLPALVFQSRCCLQSSTPSSGASSSPQLSGRMCRAARQTESCRGACMVRSAGAPHGITSAMSGTLCIADETQRQSPRLPTCSCLTAHVCRQSACLLQHG